MVTEVSEGRVHAQGPLISTPNLSQHSLEPADELLILGSDGLWDVVTSQAAVSYARRHLLQPGANPDTCSAALVRVLFLSSSLHASPGALLVIIWCCNFHTCSVRLSQPGASSSLLT